jgi:hypothetical protein
MSRWSEMLAELDRQHDTTDSIDTNEPGTPADGKTPVSVSCVNGVTAPETRDLEERAIIDRQHDTVDTSRHCAEPAPAVSHTVNSVTPSDAHDLDERAAIVEYGAGVPRAWAEGYAALSTMPAPTGFLPDRWARIVDAAGAFIDRWASTAAECGWSDLDVFGCDPDAPDRRFDCMGLVLLLDRVEVVGIDQDGADLITQTGAGQRYRRRPLPPDTVSLWKLASQTKFAPR